MRIRPLSSPHQARRPRPVAPRNAPTSTHPMLFSPADNKEGYEATFIREENQEHWEAIDRCHSGVRLE